MGAINWHSVFFLLFSLVACIFALCVVFSSNIVRMALYLVMSLGATAGLFFLAGADFVGAMQLLIYVGGTLVLLVFGVMLTAQGPFISMKTSQGDWISAAFVGGSLLAVLLTTTLMVRDWRNQPATANTVVTQFTPDPTATPLAMGLLGARVDRLAPNADKRPNVLSGYLLPFEVVSVHLLVVLVGAAYLARTKKRSDRRDDF